MARLLNDLKMLWGQSEVWFQVILLVVVVIVFVAQRTRTSRSGAIQATLLVAALWLIWLPLASGGEYLMFGRVQELFSPLRVLGFYLCVAGALFCAYVASKLPNPWLQILALAEIMLLAAGVFGLELAALLWWEYSG